MSFDGPSLLKNMLLFEAANNIPLAIALGLYPNFTLSFLLKPAQITPATETLGQLSSAFLFGMTVPLLLAYPDGPQAEPKRKLAYWALASSEVLALAYNLPYLLGGAESGWFPAALLTAQGLMSVFLSWRLFVLLAKPEWISPQGSLKKNV
ncbi:hypothetical protein K431DRAFT_284776 [Polychaeton citri CBS 116435]|uniref:Uncharacterized protein n=1 Tax=Polychaeton citri CBS 116435 TaxID=1314669 RepID=A0A9P4Q8X0_9PEZI|nr:hypothetical protein K431DRAFT_284776 [Polychaeton citri CBS 116435]